MDDWRHAAACRGGDPELWFPAGWPGPALADIEQALSVCRRCPVREDCLRWALDNRIGYGIWGGLSAFARRQLARRSE